MQAAPADGGVHLGAVVQGRHINIAAARGLAEAVMAFTRLKRFKEWEENGGNNPVLDLQRARPSLGREK